MKVLENDFLDACHWLADEHNILLTAWKPAEKTIPAKPFDAARYERFFQRPYLNEAARRFLYQDRLLDTRVVRWCRLTSWTDLGGTNWLQTPYYDMDGKLVGVQNRNLDYRKGTDGIRFRFPSGSQCHIYNLPVLKMLREGEPLYITEGCSDCWAMLSAGHKAIAIPSATLLKPEDAKMLSELTQRLSSKVRMYPDQDLPGETLFRQLQKILPAIEHHQLPAGCKDFAEYYVNLERKEAEDEAV